MAGVISPFAGGIGVTITNTPLASQVLETTSTTQAAWTTPPGGPPSGAAGGDLGGTYPLPTVVASHLAAPLPLAQGGTSQATAQAAMDTLAGAVTSGQYLRGNGTHVALAAIVAGDVPTLNQSTSGNAATATNLAGGATLPSFLAPAAASALSFGVGMAPNLANANDFTVTLTASTGTFVAPTNPVHFQTMRIHITQDGTGNRTIASWSADYDFGAAGTPVLSTGANKVDVIGFLYNATLAKWVCVGTALGF